MPLRSPIPETDHGRRRGASLQPDQLEAEQPIWAALPAVQAGQVAGWSAETVLSYQGFTTQLQNLAEVLRSSEPGVT